MNIVNSLLAAVRGSGDASFAIAVLAIVVLLVAPVPPAAMDALLALNLAAAATILVVTLFARSTLRFATFPTLLLLTTLFRLALNVSSTRLVLSRGDAGRVIEAFGRVVVQGNAVVGGVVFAILALVQFLVVAKGAERVAEVAARFTLDALPGKQMAIDADLRAGAVDQAEARRRRRALERESQLYGAMDGALKFVKGDAIAGIAIVLVNLVGGLAAGAMRGMDLAEAARRYALLAIGDGLVSQIPALLVAVSAGVAVTRVAAEDEDGSLGGEIGRQLTAEPRALAAVAALLASLALAPGLPALPFAALAAAAAFGAHRLARARARPAQPPSAGAEDGSTACAEPFGPAAPIAVELGSGLFELSRGAGGPLSREGLDQLRESIWHDLGVRLPEIAVRAGELPSSAWELRMDGVPLARGSAPADEAVVLAAPDELALAGIEVAAEEDPLTGRTVSRVRAGDAPRASALGPVRSQLDRVVAGVAWALSRTAYHFVGVQETQVLLDSLEQSAPALVREASRHLPPALLADVLRRLVEEGVSIRPLRTILEALLETGAAQHGGASLAEVARRALRLHIGYRIAESGALTALLLDPAAEDAVRSALTGDALALDPAMASSLLDALERELAPLPASPVLLASPDVRRALRGLLAPRFPRVAVLAYGELPPEMPVRPVGKLALTAA